MKHSYPTRRSSDLLPGIVYAYVQLNPYKEADIISFDASKAEKMPGVLRILKIKGGIAAIATNSWYAIKAAEAVKRQWAKGNYPADQADHWALLEASFVPEKLDKVWRNDGDVDTAKRGRELKIGEAAWRERGWQYV